MTDLEARDEVTASHGWETRISLGDDSQPHREIKGSLALGVNECYLCTNYGSLPPVHNSPLMGWVTGHVLLQLLIYVGLLHQLGKPLLQSRNLAPAQLTVISGY